MNEKNDAISNEMPMNRSVRFSTRCRFCGKDFEVTNFQRSDTDEELREELREKVKRHEAQCPENPTMHHLCMVGRLIFRLSDFEECRKNGGMDWEGVARKMLRHICIDNVYYHWNPCPTDRIHRALYEIDESVKASWGALGSLEDTRLSYKLKAYHEFCEASRLSSYNGYGAHWFEAVFAFRTDEEFSKGVKNAYRLLKEDLTNYANAMQCLVGKDGLGIVREEFADCGVTRRLKEMQEIEGKHIEEYRKAKKSE